MSKILLRVAQIVGVLVLAGIAVGVVVGLVQWLLGAAVIVAVPLGAWWLYKRVSNRNPKPTAVSGMPKAVTGPSGDRRSELESRAVLDAAGRCGWCGSATLHKDEFGFPTTPLTFHRAEIDAML
jgi:Flp pilus assembly protein TadB